ncbi:hypothetical protein NDU88_001427 [Pleurodeles waltl]|uniref:Uncharacterized protein n=1 Tax=Pleurodeles waltl TaxID=8319 RepID=A0AAV7V7S5_PLEWA|nr:hypothetical protein NDU88_001427 [Pleurodeles waltl]
MTSCVVDLHTAFEMAEPVTLCWAAVIRSVMDCPDIVAQTPRGDTSAWFYWPGAPAAGESGEKWERGMERQGGGYREG